MKHFFVEVKPERNGGGRAERAEFLYNTAVKKCRFACCFRFDWWSKSSRPIRLIDLTRWGRAIAEKADFLLAATRLTSGGENNYYVVVDRYRAENMKARVLSFCQQWWLYSVCKQGKICIPPLRGYLVWVHTISQPPSTLAVPERVLHWAKSVWIGASSKLMTCGR